MIVRTRAIITMETQLRNIPRTWLNIIEPRLERPEGGTCWLWTGAVDGAGHPCVAFRISKDKRSTKRIARIGAALFWELKPHHEVVHSCGVLNCMNPAHWYISALHWKHEDRKKMAKVKQRNIHDHQIKMLRARASSV